MNQQIENHLKSVLQHLYINPLEKCNLRCKICYTKKTNDILSENQILNFIKRYQKEIELKVITFCGGEVMALPYFPRLVNKLAKQGIFIQIITNGTLDVLVKFKHPNNVNLIVSIDGPEKYHDTNRGTGTFKKSIAFLMRGKLLGFHTEIFSIVTKQNFPLIPEFEISMRQLGYHEITYHPRKPLSYLSVHPISNITGQTAGFDFLADDEIKRLMRTKKTFPPRTLGCYQIALVSNGSVYGCCEGFDRLGYIDDPILSLIQNLEKKISGPCLGCYQPNFMCGLKSQFNNRI